MKEPNNYGQVICATVVLWSILLLIFLKAVGALNWSWWATLTPLFALVFLCILVLAVFWNIITDEYDVGE